MSKFLKLIEENKPGEGPFTVEYKDKDGNLMATLTLPNDVGSSYENFLKFAEENGGQLRVEDDEMKDSMWYKRPIAIQLDGKYWLVPMMDDEGNDGGAMSTTFEDLSVIPVIS